MKKYVLLTLISLMAVCLMAPACNAAGETKSIRFWSDQSEPWQQQVITAMVQDFESSHPGVKVEVEYIAFKDRQAKMTAALAAQDVPEVALLSSQYATSLPAAGALKNLDDLVKDLGGPAAFSGASLGLARYNDHFYSLPWCTAPVVMWYRKDRLSENGLKPPQTMEEFTAPPRSCRKRERGNTSPWALPSAAVNLPMKGSAAWPCGRWAEACSMET
jgi:ABC-type glycerol-3-phosphate transport system substrate-binding protein